MSEQPYFRLIRPEKQTLPVVVDVPHAGEWIPDEILRDMAVQNKTLRRDLDLYVDRLWQDAPKLGATLIASNVSRYVVDLNRADDDVSPDVVLGARSINRPGYYQERGVIWKNTTDGIPVLSRPMTRAAFKQRIATFHTPYHNAIAEEIARVREQFGYCLLIDGHSMPSKGRVGHSDPGTWRADIVPGDVERKSCSPLLTNIVSTHFREQGYSVTPNQPYKGGWITRSFGTPKDGVHAIQIEVNRALYMDEATFEIKQEGIVRLASACHALLPKLENLLGG